MKDQRSIPVQLVVDEEFEKSFWSYDPEKVLRKASEEFGKEFGLAGFRIASRKTWDSCGSSCLKNFPHSFIREIPATLPPEKVGTFLLSKFKNEIRILSGHELDEIFDVAEVLKGKESNDYKLGLLARRLQEALKRSLSEDLISSFRNKGGVVIGFTGKWFPIGNTSIAAFANSQQNCLVMGILSQPVKAFLHEVGHIFGAEHSDCEESIMFPEASDQRQKFTKEDKAQIIEGLQRKAMK